MQFTRKLGYWVTTGFAVLLFGASGAVDFSGMAEAAADLAHLGYPGYFGKILGTWKMLGAFAIAVPRFARLKEWAYAGMVFDLTGAAASHALRGDGLGSVGFPLLLLVGVVASWALRPDSRKLGPT